MPCPEYPWFRDFTHTPANLSLPSRPALTSRLRQSDYDSQTESDSEMDSYSSSSEEYSDRSSLSTNVGEMTEQDNAAENVDKTTAEEVLIKECQLALLQTAYPQQDTQQITGTPIFTHGVLENYPSAFSQYGLLGGNASVLDALARDPKSARLEPRLYFNIAAPSSVFICGSQGSGKSHTLSCLLENCLVKSFSNRLQNPLAGLIFHYDTFTSDTVGTPCEAAYLASDEKINVKILCSPTNVETIKRTYAGLNVEVEPLKIDQKDLDTKKMLDLMAVRTENGPMPLYLHLINRILRELRIKQQAAGLHAHFNYAEFRNRLDAEHMTPAQLAPLQQRLDTLESFMDASQTSRLVFQGSEAAVTGNDWRLQAGMITIVDLSCPCVTAEGACALFNICLGIFMSQKEEIGRFVALDEAHKYMDSATEATTLTNSLLSAIRLQRHLGTRVFISTQEPTISPKLLDLCSATIVHRFTSPEWLHCLKAHLAALDDVVNKDGNSNLKNVLQKIVTLRVGEALLFAPSAMVDESGDVGDSESDSEGGVEVRETKRLGMEYLRIRVRARITADGGKSQMAN